MQLENIDIKLNEKVEKLINNEFRKLLIYFLNKKKHTGSNAILTYKSAIQRFILFANKSNISDINQEDKNKYLTYLNIQKLKISYKSSQLRYLKCFFDFVSDEYAVLEKEFLNPFITPKKTIKLDKEIEKLINNEFRELLMRYMSKKLRTGSKTMLTYKSAIQRFILFTNKSNISDIKRKDGDKYLTYLDNRNYKLSYKSSQLMYLRSFFKFVIEEFEGLEKQYFNPIPELGNYNFSADPVISIKKQQEKEKDEYFIIDKEKNVNELKEIIQKSYFANYELFIKIVVLTFCGMRASEMLTIKIENINIKERYLLTGIVENARKSSRHSNGIYYCFPEQVSVLLFEYMNYHNKKYGKNQWLFPAKKVKDHAKIRDFHSELKNLNCSFNVRTHKFRKSLSTYRREINEIKTPTYIMETLSNHKISSLEQRTYSKYPIEKRREDYDRYFPEEYKELLNFISNF